VCACVYIVHIDEVYNHTNLDNLVKNKWLKQQTNFAIGKQLAVIFNKYAILKRE